MNFDEAVRLINQCSEISVFPHVSADGDSIGAAFSLKLALENIGKKVTVYVEEEIQNRYLFAISEIDYIIVNNDNIHEIEDIKSDLAIVVDCADIKRLGSRIKLFGLSEHKILIDHHVSNIGFADFNYVDVKWAATVVGISLLLKDLGIGLDYKMSTLLYVGLVTDTGGFRYSNTNSQTHIMAAELLEYGVNSPLVMLNVFENITHGRYRLNAELARRTEFFFDGKVCMCYLPEEAFAECEATEEDGEGIVDYLRNIEGVEVGIYIKDKANVLKISMRAKSYVDVSRVAAIFGGGGHERASGASYIGGVKELKAKLLEELKTVI